MGSRAWTCIARSIQEYRSREEVTSELALTRSSKTVHTEAKMSSVPKLTISLVNTNNRDLLRACLQSLYSVDHSASFEVILVDNLSTDGSREMVAAEFSKVQLVLNGARQGFGANHNQAIRR